MIILDENILDGQRLLLQAWRVAVRQIGFDLVRKGLKDEEILVLLHRQRNPTFFTRNGDFYHPKLRHPSYCLLSRVLGKMKWLPSLADSCAIPEGALLASMSMGQPRRIRRGAMHTSPMRTLYFPPTE